jgi:hypothetical protein
MIGHHQGKAQGWEIRHQPVPKTTATKAAFLEYSLVRPFQRSLQTPNLNRLKSPPPYVDLP